MPVLVQDVGNFPADSVVAGPQASQVVNDRLSLAQLFKMVNETYARNEHLIRVLRLTPFEGHEHGKALR